MEDVLGVCLDVFPWISEQATLIGVESRDQRFASLGAELHILWLQLQSQACISPNLIQIAGLVSKACSLVRARRTDREQPLDTLQHILKHKDSNTPDEIRIIDDLRYSLPQFVQNDPEYHVLLRLIHDCRHETDLPDPLSNEDTRPSYADSKYPDHVNNTLYAHLRIYSSCSCNSQHLEYARLRLDTGQDKEEYVDIPFEMLFEASPALAQANCTVRWQEAKLWVPRHVELPKEKQVIFAIKSTKTVPRRRSNPPLHEGAKKVQIGEFCRLIGGADNTPIHFHIRNNTMRYTYPAPGTTWRDFLPQDGVPLSEWLEQTAYLSNRVKITLAYTIAKSVWQYYNSDWMETPWIHDKIQMFKERINVNNRIRPHPYLTAKLYKHKRQIQDYYEADNLLHMYPNVLALAIVLIEIATKKRSTLDNPHGFWDVTTINDYYEWAWRTANRSDLRSTVGVAYEKVVNNCLDSELFRDGPIDESRPDKNLNIRQSILYDKIVVPLQELYHAYMDDWDIQETAQVPPQFPSSLNSTSEPCGIQTPPLQPSSHTKFCVAIFCALPLEADAIRELLDEVWSEEDSNFEKSKGDDNTYTLGRISRHNVVLVHLPGMGKSAASQAASGLRSSYPEIKLALVVGICGGVPAGEDNEELILGDVVISDGIVQYDLGRQFPDEFSSKNGQEGIGRPPSRIRSMLAKFKGLRSRQRLEKKLAKYLDVLQEAVGAERAGYPGIDKDELYDSTYRHKHQHTSICSYCSKMDAACKVAREKTCQQLGCEKDMLLPRKRLQQASAARLVPNPKIHFGLIGSGDTVMKSGQHRNQIAAQHHIIALEMEAAGVCDNLPCLVIKGVCDYADSHKNKYWQNYAAATAAACTKAILDDCKIIH
ncbi:hypothetical protein BJX63DRAFT_396877 [Aspergillus granulosus]|uniref:Nucleoside phosphorylase domain-containing protein n=1 Tax=Aspergillus granulosus TaxID=176169 RepID=A0ABR4HAA7_9EURO